MSADHHRQYVKKYPNFKKYILNIRELQKKMIDLVEFDHETELASLESRMQRKLWVNEYFKYDVYKKNKEGMFVSDSEENVRTSTFRFFNEMCGMESKVGLASSFVESFQWLQCFS